MLDTKLFINQLIENGYTHLCVVPCSFAKNVINEVINNPNIEYLPSASEAVACSVAAGRYSIFGLFIASFITFLAKLHGTTQR